MSGVTASSLEVRPGMIFVAICGTKDGHAYIREAIERGAREVVGQWSLSELELRFSDMARAIERSKTPYRVVTDSRRELSRLAAEFEGHPSHGMKVIGVTGTSGKTTTTFIIESILKAAGLEPGLMGTVETRYRSVVKKSSHTTPDAAALQRLLAEMKAAGCQSVVMEVSSHALDQCRAADVAFDSMVFTNLTSEHLDYHRTLEAYFEAKSRLFFECADYSRRVGKKPQSIIALDTEWGVQLAQKLPQAITVGAEAASALSSTLAGISGTANGITVTSKLVGAFNMANLLCAIEATRAVGVSDAAIEKGIRALDGVPGRLEQVVPGVFVDYAHKPDALEQVLHILRDDVKGRLLLVFGCGGDRDTQKRPVMGAIAARLSDAVWITSDNPRSEDPAQIIAAIKRGAEHELARLGKAPEVVTTQGDRRQAIEAALAEKGPNDVVVIAGKGHETTQTIGSQILHFDDREIVRSYFT